MCLCTARAYMCKSWVHSCVRMYTYPHPSKMKRLTELSLPASTYWHWSRLSTLPSSFSVPQASHLLVFHGPDFICRPITPTRVGILSTLREVLLEVALSFQWGGRGPDLRVHRCCTLHHHRHVEHFLMIMILQTRGLRECSVKQLLEADQWGRASHPNTHINP